MKFIKKTLSRTHEFLSLLWKWFCFPFRMLGLLCCNIMLFILNVYKWFFIIGGIVFFLAIVGAILDNILKRFHFG